MVSLLKIRYKMKKWILFTLLCSWVYEDLTPELCLSSGCIRGSVGAGGSYNQYLGIPYAYTDKDNWFKDPLPVKKWDGIFYAINENIRCPQAFTSFMVLGIDNCLRVNVYTPTSVAAAPRPVMVFIHGGAFLEGSGNSFIYGPEYLISNDVILVTFNYRLSIPGFLCLGIKEAPGNAGMKDQVAALKWVKENIKLFGGDDNNVTIFGESSGGASVSFHILSPMSKGLFDKAILQSGSSLAPWALQYRSMEVASFLANFMGFQSNDPHELYNFFIDKTHNELLLIRPPRREGNTIGSEFVLSPCVEKEIEGVEPFLKENPYDLLQRGHYNKVPIMMGYNSDEGYIFMDMESKDQIESLTFENAMPDNFEFSNDVDKRTVANKIKEFYTGTDKVSKQNIVKFYGEYFFSCPIELETELYLKTNNNSVYNYKFSYDGLLNVVKWSTTFKAKPGATHGDELFYLFQPKLLTPARFLESKMVNRMTTMWTNFAKFGVPIPEKTKLLPMDWEPTDKKDPTMLVIDEEFSLEPLWSREVLSYWKQTFLTYRKKIIH